MSYAQMPEMDEPLSDDERDKLINDLAKKIVDRGMETPAVLFLEMHKPISFLAGQSMIAASPFLVPLFGQAGVRGYSQLLNEPDNVERLIRRIEDLSVEKDIEKKREKK